MLASLHPQAEKKGPVYVTDFEAGGQASFGTPEALTPSASITLDASLSNVFTLVPEETGDILVINAVKGQRITLIITTSGTSSFTLTFLTGFKSTGTLATGTTSAKIFVVDFISDGTNVIEVSRTTAQ